MANKRCPVCFSPTKGYEQLTGNDYYSVDCFRCGGYNFDEKLDSQFPTEFDDPTKIANVSSWLREQNTPGKNIPRLRSDLYWNLRNLNPLAVGEKATRLLKMLALLNPIPGTVIDLSIPGLTDFFNNPKRVISPALSNFLMHSLPLLAYAWTIDQKELRFIISDYLFREKNYISLNGKNAQITPMGWAYLDSIKFGNPESHKAFIAMWFDKGLNDVYTNIYEAISRSGYEPFRIDKHEHTNNINDEILAQIRSSKFIVADYTSQNHGVYFESGFAMGLNLRVVWICDKDDKNNLHFDTSHYNFIFYKKDKLEDLIERLQFRIERLVGKGLVPYEENKK